MSIAIKPRTADQVRIMAERYPDETLAAIAKKGGWELNLVRASLSRRRPDKPKSRAS